MRAPVGPKDRVRFAPNVIVRGKLPRVQHLFLNMNTSKLNKTAPFLSIDAFGQPDQIEEHYKKWLQYEVANGDSAKSWQQTFDIALLKILKRRRGIEFKESPEMGKKPN